MKENKNKIIKIGLITIGVILICALCFFASVAASDGDEYSKNASNNGSNAAGSDITSIAQAESNSIKEEEKSDFNDINVDKFIEMYNGEEKKIVLFSRPTCGYCQIAEPILQNIIYKYNIEINHVNTDESSEEDFNNLTKTDSSFENFGTPYLTVVQNGKIVDSIQGLSDTKGYIEFFKNNNFISE